MTGKNFYGWWVVAASFPIALYVSGIVFYGFTAFFEPLIKEFGWSYAEVSFAASLRGLEAGIFAPFVGLLADRLGSRKLILSGVILTGLGLILLSFTRSLPMFYGAFFLLALGAGGCMGLVTMSMVAHWFEKNAGKAFGIMSSAFGASGLIVPLIVWLTDTFHWRSALIILAVVLWAFGIPLSFVIRDRPDRPGHLPDGVHSGRSVPRHGNQPRKVKFGLKEALRNRSFLYLTITETIRVTAVSAVVTHVMPYLSHAGISRPVGSLAAAAIPLCSIAGRFGFGWAADTFEKKHIIILTLCLTGVGLMAFCYAQVKWILFLSIFLFSAGHGGGMVLRNAILKDYFGTDSFGAMLGMSMGISSVGGVIGPTFAGWIFDAFKDYRLAWLVLIGLVGVAVYFIANVKPLPSAGSLSGAPESG